jgi:hypothetical protein
MSLWKSEVHDLPRNSNEQLANYRQRGAVIGS